MSILISLVHNTLLQNCLFCRYFVLNLLCSFFVLSLIYLTYFFLHGLPTQGKEQRSIEEENRGRESRKRKRLDSQIWCFLVHIVCLAHGHWVVMPASHSLSLRHWRTIASPSRPLPLTSDLPAQSSTTTLTQSPEFSPGQRLMNRVQAALHVREALSSSEC